MEEQRLTRRTVAFVGIAAVWLFVALPALLGSTLWFRDLLLYAYPQKLYVIERLRGGQLPLWCDTWGTGRPHFGLLQPGALDPFNVLLLLPRPLNVDLYNLAHLAVVMLGTRAWLRRRGCGEGDSAVAGAALGLSGYFASMLSTNGTYAWGVAFVPWFLAALEAAIAAPTRGQLVRATVLAAAACALGLLAGDPLSVVFAAMAGLATAAVGRTTASRRRAFAVLGAAIGLAALVCAAQVLPALDVARTYRADGVSLRNASTFSLHPLRLLELITPEALGPPLGDHWYAPTLYTRSAHQRLIPLALSLYQGLAIVPLAALAVVRGGRFERALAALATGAALLAAGRHLPLWPLLFEHVPGANLFRGPEKAWFLVSLCLAALAARGLPMARARARMATIVACAMAGLLGIVALLDPSGRDGGLPALRGPLLVAAGWALAYAGAFWASTARRVRAGLASVLPSIIFVADVLVGTAPLYPWAPPGEAYAKPPFVQMIEQDRGGSARGSRVFRDVLLRFAGSGDDAAAMVETLMPNVGLLDGVGHLDSYDAIAPTRIRRIREEVRRTPRELLAYWGIEYAVLPIPDPLPAGMHEVGRLSERGLRLVRVDGPAPRVYLATETVAVGSPESALDAARSPSFRAGAMATVEGPPRSTQGRCAVERSRPEEQQVTCDSEQEGWLIVGESFDPVWKATVNGAAVRLVRGNELYQAIPVPAGRSTVRLWVEPSGLALGGLLSVLGLAAAVALWLLAGRARWSPRRVEGGAG